MYTQDDNYDAFVSYARASGSAANVTREQFYEVCVCVCVRAVAAWSVRIGENKTRNT